MFLQSSLPIVLKQNNFLVIGAGKVAQQKIEVLGKNGIYPTIIAKENPFNWEDVVIKEVEVEDCRNFDAVIDATGSDEVRGIVLEAKKQYGFLLNRVDAPNECDFYFATLAYFGDIKVAVSTNGASPTIGQEISKFIQRSLSKKLEQLAAAKKNERLAGMIDPNATRQETRALLGHVYLVGCGIGDVELLTLKAYRIIQEMDVIFVDHLISPEILEIIPKSTQQIYVGKKKDQHTSSQDEINDLLLEYAQKGLRVARLKSGDPYIFGRGAEEAMYLAQRGIRVDVIPGISSAIAGPLSAGIAPTARGYSTSLSIVTAHLKDNLINLDWITLLKMKNHTTIVLMAVSRAREIIEKAIEIGVDSALPVAVISNASRPQQEVVVTTLGELADAAANAKRPAILVFGEVVNLHGQLPIAYPVE